ncbi:MAG TPA: tetratricopeptide repeat protein, partial [Acidobacteriota bacterium]|nr:tetratricopeptide repeat protein [Acidobacteriota bacterium]
YQLSSLKESAAQVLLGAAYQLTVSHFEDEWKQKIGLDWEERYQYVQKSSQILAEFDARREQNLEFDESDLWKYAALTAEFQETEKALPLLTQLLKENPQHTEANFLYGQCLLKNGDAAGIPYIERAIEQDFQNSEPGYQILLQFCLDHELKDEFEKHKLQLIRFYDRMEMARRERQSVTEHQLKSHRMSPEVVRRLSDQLAAFPQVKIAYLAEKDVRVFPEIPYLVLGIVPNFPWLTYDTDKAMNRLLQELINNVKFPYETYVIVLGKTSENFKMRFEAISNAQIYSK